MIHATNDIVSSLCIDVISLSINFRVSLVAQEQP